MNFFKLADVDVTDIQQEIVTNFAEFDVDVQRQTQIINGVPSYHAETKNYRLSRGVVGDAKDVFHTELLEKTPLYYQRPVCVAFLNKFVELYGGEVHRISIVLLPAGKEVLPHPDGGTYYQNKDRFHLAIFGEYDMSVYESGVAETQKIRAGELWFFDNKKVHSTKNNGTEDRIAMIFDVSNSSWRKVCDAV